MSDFQIGCGLRERAMPLVPEPFLNVARARQALFAGHDSTISGTWAKFCPNLNIPAYQEGLSEKKRTELDKRATRLTERAANNHIYSSSEFGWEVSAWNDVFGLLYEDESFRMDKRPYEYLETDDAGNKTVKKKIPDATIGLKSYDEFFLKRGYICSVPDCEDDHDSMQADERLSERRLQAMMHNPECGLVVDGDWGKTDLVFPFAVYEAKKKASDFEQAESQIYHACMTYLAMLDDLVRNPDRVSEYQTETSGKYHIFAFASCGACWQVFVAFPFLGTCTIETIWQGNVLEFSRAYDLICIVDQIHHYARSHHRPFVLEHLEAWHSRHEKTLRDAATSAAAAAAGGGAAGSRGLSGSGPLRIADLVAPEPEWMRLKDLSRLARQERANETRYRNQERRDAAVGAAVVGAVAPDDGQTTTLSPRARSPARDGLLPDGGGGAGSSPPSKKNRPRGRPRKVQLEEVDDVDLPRKESTTFSLPVKRPRGRPRKVPQSNEKDPGNGEDLYSDGAGSIPPPAAKRPRGRAPKGKPETRTKERKGALAEAVAALFSDPSF